MTVAKFLCKHKPKVLHLIVTGYTPAMAEIIAQCALEKIILILYHFNPATGQYSIQYT